MVAVELHEEAVGGVVVVSEVVVMAAVEVVAVAAVLVDEVCETHISLDRTGLMADHLSERRSWGFRWRQRCSRRWARGPW